MPAFFPEGDTPLAGDPSNKSLQKINSLLQVIEAKTGSATITGPVTVTNEVEIKNDANNPLPVSDNGGSLTVDGSVSVSNFPATQPVSLASVPSHPVTGPLTNTELRLTAVPVSLASAPVTPVTDNGGSLTVDGTVTVNDMTSGNAKTKIVDSAGADVSYIPAGTAGTPSASVLSVQGISGGTSLPISGTVDTGLTQPLTDTQLRAAVVPVSLASVPSHPVTGSGSFTAAQATASSLKAQAQILDSAGSLLTYAATGTAGTPGVDVVSIQGVSSGVAVTVSGPVTDTQLRASAISVSDRGSVGQATVTTFTSTSSLVLMASNSARKLLTVFNEGAGVLYLLYGAGTASITNYSVRINSGDYLEIEKYTGAVTGIFGTAGTARATEIS